MIALLFFPDNVPELKSGLPCSMLQGRLTLANPTSGQSNLAASLTTIDRIHFTLTACDASCLALLSPSLSVPSNNFGTELEGRDNLHWTPHFSEAIDSRGVAF